MITSLTLATQRPFGTLTCDFYKNDAGEFYMTRTQIGKALECKKADDGIQQIHSRNADRLDPLSSTLVLGVEVSNRGETYTRPQNVFVYSLKGVLEIRRFSRQPKADKFMDFVWDVIISLMQGETVLTPVQQQQQRESNTIRAAATLLARREQGHSIIAVNRTPRNYHCSELFNSNHTGTQAVRTQKYIISSQ